jgi:hypothetical protein
MTPTIKAISEFDGAAKLVTTTAKGSAAIPVAKPPIAKRPGFAILNLGKYRLTVEELVGHFEYGCPSLCM